MTDSAWLLAASLTFAASAHCVGMCGGFVLAIGAFENGRRLRLFLEHVLLQIGKATTYAFLGTFAGAFGATLIQNPAFQWGERTLALVAGAGLALAGLTLLGLRSGRAGAFTNSIAGAWTRFVAPLVANRPFGGSLLVGMALGLLPKTLGLNRHFTSTAPITDQLTSSWPCGSSSSNNSSNRRAFHNVHPSHTSPN